VASGIEERDEQITERLPSAASQIRAALSGLRVVGNVPGILFVKDESVARLQEVERRLKIADMGPPRDSVVDEHTNESEDDEMIADNSNVTTHSRESLQESIASVGRHFESSESRGILRPDGAIEIIPRTNTNDASDTSSHEEKDLNRTEADTTQTISEYMQNISQPFPTPFKSNIYGLDYDKLVERVLRAKRKAKSLTPRITNSKHDESDKDPNQMVRGIDKRKEENTRVKEFNRSAITSEKKKGRMFRNPDSVLSSLHYQDENGGFDSQSRRSSHVDDVNEDYDDERGVKK